MPHDEADRKAGCRSGRLQGSTELIPETGSAPDFDIVYPETPSEKPCRFNGPPFHPSGRAQLLDLPLPGRASH
jgi:hypothetical protein